jgi:RecA-family ATPase
VEPELNEHFKNRHVVILPDNDQPGRWHASQVATNLHGIAASLKIVELPGLGDKQDVSDWLDAGNLYQNIAALADKTPLWLPDPDAPAPPLNEEAKTTEEENKPPPLPFINIAAWLAQPVPERQWIVRDRIPANNVTLLSGEGSVGKSILSLHLATAVVLGRDWLSALPELGAAIVVCCEDDDSELWRRLDLIFQHYNASYSDFKDLHLLSLAGQETLMATPDRSALMQPTKLFARVHEAACDMRPKLIVLDNSADVFGGNENDRAQVRQFIGLLRGMAIASGAGVLLTSHPSLAGISSGTGLSGSTAWNASVRSRLYFKRATTEKDEEPDPDLRVLEVMKSNYGPVGETINLRWKNGLFVPAGGVSNLERLAAEQATDLLFMDLLARFSRQGRNVSDKLNASNYAPAIFAGQPEAKAARVSKSALAAAMDRLFAADKIHVESYGRPSRLYSKLVIGSGK